MKRVLESSDSEGNAKLQKLSHQNGQFQAIKVSQVPRYLRNSYFYKSLCNDDDDDILIPANHMKPDLSLQTPSDLVELLNTVRFWILETIPRELMSFLVYKAEDCAHILADYSSELRYLTAFKHLNHFSMCDKMTGAMETGVLELVEFLYEEGWTISHAGLEVAVANNHFECVRFAFDVMRNKLNFNGENYRSKESGSMCEQAIMHGNIECVELLRKHRYPYPTNAAHIAAASGQLRLLKYMHEQRKLTFTNFWYHVNSASAAARNGHLDCLAYLHSLDFPLDGVPSEAAAGGHLNCLQFVESNGGLSDEQAKDAAITAIMYKQPHIVDYLFQHYRFAFESKPVNWCQLATSYGVTSCLALFHEREHECKWEKDTCMDAILAKRFDCFLYCARHGCPFNPTECVLAVARPRSSFTSEEDSPEEAQQRNACLKDLLKLCGNNATSITTTIASEGNIIALRKLIEQGWPVDAAVAKQAARNNDIITLQAYCKAGHLLPASTLTIAAELGHLASLQYVHQQGCEWTTKVCAVAAQHGHLKCLQYAHEHGCPWNSAVYERAARNYRKECFLYAYMNDCPQNGLSKLARNYMREVMKSI